MPQESELNHLAVDGLAFRWTQDWCYLGVSSHYGASLAGMDGFIASQVTELKAAASEMALSPNTLTELEKSKLYYPHMEDPNILAGYYSLFLGEMGGPCNC